MISRNVARQWMETWDAQQQIYAVRREHRFAVVSKAVKAATGHSDTPIIIDIGAGPGSLAEHIARDMPDARVIAIEADPFLIELGRAAFGKRIEFVETTAGADGWLDAVGVDRIDAAVSSTALHYFAVNDLARLYHDLHKAVSPGGLVVNADHFPLNPLVGELLGNSGDGGTAWQQWWNAARACDDLTTALALREHVVLPDGGDNDLSADAHMLLLSDAGFTATDVIWRDGVSTIVAARK
ncbi:class I SAM-dependent methyltransferase [Hoyosella rhizosphaerae]|uniref:SAM-dependent methyltransferase n=1 Tax=Hoyosella rhizosphaerae TaxID=1755582 RepID=A0A916U175_9ACTN|nr:class I SAM-dependent methyltransferase [Hoyosella rhizosphaerae]MBN4926942.1 class I SAM-dependent methyltransferase [Hoyosella rhizosphaerae]GGC55308.1 SAM-dependent methyltransferase [Hoyosella rhizosphaerae]